MSSQAAYVEMTSEPGDLTVSSLNLAAMLKESLPEEWNIEGGNTAARWSLTSASKLITGSGKWQQVDHW